MYWQGQFDLSIPYYILPFIIVAVLYFSSKIKNSEDSTRVKVNVQIQDTLNVAGLRDISDVLQKIENVDSMLLEQYKTRTAVSQTPDIPDTKTHTEASANPDSSVIRSRELDSIIQKNKVELLAAIEAIIKRQVSAQSVSASVYWYRVVIYALIIIMGITPLIYICKNYKGSSKGKIALFSVAGLFTSFLACLEPSMENKFDTKFDTKFLDQPVFNIDFGQHVNMLSRSRSGSSGRSIQTIKIGAFVPGYDRINPADTGWNTDTLNAFTKNKFSDIYIYGGVDRRPLKNKARLKFGDNLNLAEARANFIKNKLKERFRADSSIQYHIIVNGANNFPDKDDYLLYTEDRYVKVVGVCNQ